MMDEYNAMKKQRKELVTDSKWMYYDRQLNDNNKEVTNAFDEYFITAVSEDHSSNNLCTVTPIRFQFSFIYEAEPIEGILKPYLQVFEIVHFIIHTMTS